ncbi:MAG: methyltransferase domain-containing protein [Bacteroidota bacterium]
MAFTKKYVKAASRRYVKTLNFMDEVLDKDKNILDLGVCNPFTSLLKDAGYKVTNTGEQVDLDYDHDSVLSKDFDVVTAFEILEHLVNPFGVLHKIIAKELVASVPLNLWFLPPHWNKTDPLDRHYHEFYPKQFDMLLEKSGWDIKKSESWVIPSSNWGITPLFKRFLPRYYITYCTRKKDFNHQLP